MGSAACRWFVFHLYRAVVCTPARAGPAEEPQRQVEKGIARKVSRLLSDNRCRRARTHLCPKLSRLSEDDLVHRYLARGHPLHHR